MLADSLQELFDERLYGGRGAGNDTRSLRVGGQQLGRFVQHADALAVFEGFGKKLTDLGDTEIILNKGTINATQLEIGPRGALYGTGTINANLVNGGTVKFSEYGEAAGVLAVHGNYTQLEDTIRSFEEICDGKWDHLPESAFMYVGKVEEAAEKAERMAKA